MRMARAQRIAAALGLLLLLGLVVCPKWQLRRYWRPMDIGGGNIQLVAHDTVTWHRWLWNRPEDAAGIAWLYMANEAGVIVGATAITMVLCGAWARRTKRPKPDSEAA